MALSEEIQEFRRLVDQYRYDFVRLAYIIFPFGEKGGPLEDKSPYDWQLEEWNWLSSRLANPETRHEIVRMGYSSGNGAAKTAFGAMTYLMLMYTQRVRGRITANTDTQMKTVIWPEYDKWFNYARYSDVFFEKLGTSIKARDEKLGEVWRLDTVTWSIDSPASMSGLHNEGGVALYIFEEAPGIPAVVWDYTRGAFSEKNTIRIHMAFGNSDDPDSKFEQIMDSPLWHTRRMDTRTLRHIDPGFIRDILIECNGDEDHDEFRVRVRGLPRKANKDSIINKDVVLAALDRGDTFDPQSVRNLPCVLTCDPAWQGGDETCIAYRQGHLMCLLERYKLDRVSNETHQVTFEKLSKWQRELKADRVLIDQGEGTGVYTLGVNAGYTHWYLVNFSGSPTDQPEFKDSLYHNKRAQMYYETADVLREGGVIMVKDKVWRADVEKQLTWTKGGRNKTTMKKLAESKKDIKARVGSSPDIADALVLTTAVVMLDRLPEHDPFQGDNPLLVGQSAFQMPEHPDPYAGLEEALGAI